MSNGGVVTQNKVIRIHKGSLKKKAAKSDMNQTGQHTRCTADARMPDAVELITP